MSNSTTSNPPVSEPTVTPTQPPTSTPPTTPTSNPTPTPTPTQPPPEEPDTDTGTDDNDTEPSPNPQPPSPPDPVPPPVVVISSVTAEVPGTTTQIFTSVITQDATGAPQEAVTVTQTSIFPIVTSAQSDQMSSTGTTALSPAATLPGGNTAEPADDGGLSPGATIAIAVLIPLFVVALLVAGGIFFWRRRKQRKSSEEARRKEVEEYGYNPNNDPTLPTVAGSSEMAEDGSGYRGWGTATSSNRKGSTVLSGGLTSGGGHSDVSSQPGTYRASGAPALGQSADGAFVDRQELASEPVTELPADVIVAHHPASNAPVENVHRGPSNASSQYSNTARTDPSADAPIPVSTLEAAGTGQQYYGDKAYYQGQYPEATYPEGQQPVIRDVEARRNTRIENPAVYPQQGNSGIAQNF